MKLLIVLFSFLFILWPSQTGTSFAVSGQNKTYFAKVLSENIYFYSSPNDSEESKLFILPNSYFVLLINEKDDFYYAKYASLQGYVKKDEVTPMDGVPSTPYASQSFRAFAQNGLDVFSAPMADAAKCGKLSFLQENVVLYGTCYGDELFPKSTNKWYYCSLSNGGEEIKGYAFSYFCDNLTLASENMEYFPEITTPLNFSCDLPSGGGLSDTSKAMIILGVSLPCLVILYLILSPKKRRLFAKGRKEKSPPLKRGRDYYEFNEDDLN